MTETALPSDAPDAPRARPLAAGVCAALLATFVFAAWTAARQKSPTPDEPQHAMAAWMIRYHGDFRADPEDPPLWQHYASLAARPDDLRVNRPVHADGRATDAVPGALWSQHEILPPGGSDIVGLISRLRPLMLLPAALCGALVAAWAWRIAGPIAAVGATTLFACNPCFLGYAPLVKNDVSFSLCFLAAGFAAWELGRRLTISRIAALAAAVGVGAAVKFSAVLFLPALAPLLALRAVTGGTWPTGGLLARGVPAGVPRFAARSAAAAMVALVIAVVTISVLWASYDFRFRPAPEPGEHFALEPVVRELAIREMYFADPEHPPHQSDLARWRPDAATALLTFCDRHRLLPQSWLYGLLYTRVASLRRQGYLFGEHSLRGWWYYFPVAFGAKTPLATLAALALAAGVAARRALRRGRATVPLPWPQLWTMACLAVPVAVYLGAAMTAHLNLGVRHILPIYPFLFVAAGAAAARAWEGVGGAARARRFACVAVGVASLATAAIAFPDYIAFFNAAAGGPRGGLAVLGDSNLDWAQDLPAVARWRRANPGGPLYLAYFHLIDPAVYGIDAAILQDGPTGQAGRVPLAEVRGPATVAVGATVLQGIYLREPFRSEYAALRRREPIAVLGGTVYLYRLSPGEGWPGITSSTPVPATPNGGR